MTTYTVAELAAMARTNDPSGPTFPTGPVTTAGGRFLLDLAEKVVELRDAGETNEETVGVEAFVHAVPVRAGDLHAVFAELAPIALLDEMMAAHASHAENTQRAVEWLAGRAGFLTAALFDEHATSAP